MYIRKITLENIKAFSKFTWQLNKDEDPAGWHVLLGDNGAGKSTFIKSAALALLGVDQAYMTRIQFNSWIRKGGDLASIKLDICADKQFDQGGQTKGDFKVPLIFCLSDYPIKNIQGRFCNLILVVFHSSMVFVQICSECRVMSTAIQSLVASKQFLSKSSKTFSFL